MLVFLWDAMLITCLSVSDGFLYRMRTILYNSCVIKEAMYLQYLYHIHAENMNNPHIMYTRRVCTTLVPYTYTTYVRYMHHIQTIWAYSICGMRLTYVSGSSVSRIPKTNAQHLFHDDEIRKCNNVCHARMVCVQDILAEFSDSTEAQAMFPSMTTVRAQ